MSASLKCAIGIHKYKVVNVIKGVKIYKCTECGDIKKPKGGNQDVGRSGG